MLVVTPEILSKLFPISANSAERFLVVERNGSGKMCCACYLIHTLSTSLYSLNNCAVITFYSKGLFAAIDKHKAFDLGHVAFSLIFDIAFLIEE